MRSCLLEVAAITDKVNGRVYSGPRRGSIEEILWIVNSIEGVFLEQLRDADHLPGVEITPNWTITSADEWEEGQGSTGLTDNQIEYLSRVMEEIRSESCDNSFLSVFPASRRKGCRPHRTPGWERRLVRI